MSSTDLRPLKFVHITKTAGTSIENIGLRAGLAWGMHHAEYGWWHEIFPDKPNSLKNRYDWFTVVRNPYERAISECYCPWEGQGHIPEDPDQYIRARLAHASGGAPVRYRGGDREEWVGNHWTEQHRYIDPGARMHILRFESLAEDFGRLMRAYSLDLALDLHDNKPRVARTITADSLEPETVALINKVYRRDFELFGYTMLDPLALTRTATGRAPDRGCTPT